MPKIIDIERKIDELNGGQFQALCDNLLSKQGYKNLVKIGTKEGSSKTTKGTPDSYFKTENGKYIFVEYTTKKDNLFKKIKDDIEKCLDVEKTEIRDSDIEEIIYCYTSSNLLPKEDKELMNICEKRGILLKLYGINEIANDIYNKYKIIAKEHLNLSLDTGQIFEVEDFIRKYDSYDMVAPLSTKFQFREKEIEEIISNFEKNKIILLHGAAGVGKTRLALEVAQRISNEKDYKLLCIKSNKQAIFEDLKSYINTENKYLIFVDDINELINPKILLDYLTNDSKIKLIFTIRNYAKEAILNNINEITSSVFAIEIKKISDKEIKEFLIQNMEIRNEHYISKIQEIAQGNTRIAYMAGKLAIKAQNLSSVSNATELYSIYYDKYLQETDIIKNRNLCKTLGIVSITRKLDLENNNLITFFLNFFEISNKEFENSIYELEKLEILEIYRKRIVLMNEQCLANYMIYYNIYKNNYIDFSKFLYEMFKTYRGYILEAIRILLNVFRSEEMENFIKEAIDIVWMKYKKEDNNLYYDFMTYFLQFNETEVLYYINECIEKIANEDSLTDIGLMELLLKFNGSKHMGEAFELIFELIKKIPDELEEIAKKIGEAYIGTSNSYHWNYYTENILVKKLIENINIEIICDLFLKLSNPLLKTSFNPISSGEKGIISYHTIELELTKEVENYRKLIWEQLLKLSDNIKYQRAIIDILEKYSPSYNSNGKELNIFDIKWIDLILTRLDEKNYLSKILLGKISDKILKIYKKYNLDFAIRFDKILESEDWKLYSVMTSNNCYWEEKKEIHSKKIKEIIENLNSKEDIKSFISKLDNFIEENTEINHIISVNLNILIKIFWKEKKEIIIFLEVYLSKNWNLKWERFTDKVIEILILQLGIDKTYKWILEKVNYNLEDWIFNFFFIFPKEKITNDYMLIFTDFISKNIKNERIIESIFYREIIGKFLSLEPNIYINVSKIILDNKDKVNIKNYFNVLFNKYIYTFEELIEMFKDNISILKNIYIENLRYFNFYNTGEYLRKFIEIDNSWLDKYLDYIYGNENNATSKPLYENLNECWNSEKYIYIFDTVLHRYMTYTENNYLSSYYLKSILNNKDDAQLSKQKTWILHVIKENYENLGVLEVIFVMILDKNYEIRQEAIKLLISLNSNYEIFEKLSIEATRFSTSGSFVPIYMNEIKFLEKILPYFTGIKFIKHRSLIEKKINGWKESIKAEEIREVIYSDYY
nr:hypothetical protein [uncultured Leptotrichia sp.]